MSVSDPLIKDIKGHFLQLFNESKTQKITDSSPNLQNFCCALERIYYSGLIQNQTLFHANKKNDAFFWMSSLSEEGTDLIDFKYNTSLQEVQNCKRVKTSLGKFRLLMRHCLVKSCLHFPLQMLNNCNKNQNFYDRNAIIGDEILSAILLSVLLQCNKISFNLELCNSYFLDVTWQIPALVKLELIPCNSLGLSVSFSENKAVIVHIEPNGVASEYGEISTGDVLANMNGNDISSACKGRLNAILRVSKGRPVTLIIIKAFHKQSGDVFLPMKSILKNLQIDSLKITDNKSNTTQQNDSNANGVSISQNTKTGFKGDYIGSVNVGSRGSVKQIEEGIRRYLSNAGRSADKKKSIIFEIGEICIKILDSQTNELIFKHSYMQISSCGSASNLPHYIAYIAGDENCDTASNFTCYIFHVQKVEEACLILQSIGQGFYRTHFAV